MLIERQLTATVDIRDPVNFCAAPELATMNALRRRFVGRCYMGAFVVRIAEIVRRSNCRIKKTDLSGEGYVDVQFRAVVSYLGRWDLLTGVKILVRDQQIVGKSEVEGVTIASLIATPEAETVREGQTVALRIYQAEYSPGQEQATAIGTLLTCDKAATAYRVAGRLTGDDIKALDFLATRVRELLASRAVLWETRRDDLIFFETLLYAYAVREGGTQTVKTEGAPDWEGPAGIESVGGGQATTVNILGLIAAGPADMTGVWSRDLALYRSSPLAAKAKAGATPPWGTPVDSTPRAAMAAMLKSVHDFLKAVEEMAAIYDSREMLDAHKNIWTVMRRAQQPVPGN